MHTSYKPVNSVLRALDVLTSVSRLYGKASVAEVHRLTGLDKATIVRMLETLIHAGYIRRTARSIYEVTGHTLMLSSAYCQNAAGAAVAPYLDSLEAELGLPAYVGVRDGNAILIISSSQGGGPFTHYLEHGASIPMLGSAPGLAYIAHCSADERASLCRAVIADPAPWNDVARRPQQIEQLAEQIRDSRFAVMNDAYSRLRYAKRISATAVPLVHKGVLRGALTVIFKRNATDVTEKARALLSALEPVADTIASDLSINRSDAFGEAYPRTPSFSPRL